MTLHRHEEAKAEYGDASIYYEDQVKGLGERFVTRIEAATARILTNPLLPRCFDGKCRKIRAENSPISSFYRVKEDHVQILAVAHISRQSGYWKKRAKD